MSDKKDYKDTLNLPKTDFPMKADLPVREPQALKFWDEIDLYQRIRLKRKGAEKYILHDGPPYANGNIHTGHALNKTLKDIIVKYKTMRGFDSAYVPGWDCHGLPVEHQLFKELKINKYQIGQLEFRKKAHDYALRFVELQKEQFRRLGVLGEWEHPYLTLDPEYEESIISSFSSLVRKGYVYRGLKPVNWCYRCETALAEAEVEYEDHASDSVFVKFKLQESKGYRKDSYLVIWTTTPWTLLANVAVAAHPDLAYAYVKTPSGNLIIAKDLLERVLESSCIREHELLGEFKGRELEGLVYEHPFGIRSGRVVLADYVSREDGSGLVHTAPGHGNEDYFTGIKYKLDIIMPVDAKGKFDSSAKEFEGQNVLEANQGIIEKLRNAGLLLYDGKIQHSYPHCWRCKNPVIFRATKQWFLGIDRENLRKRLVNVIEKDVRWIPDGGKERISAMVQLRPDWCLSRQRYWGVPIPALVCNKCKEEFLEPQVIDKFAAFAAKEGSDCWFSREIKDFLPKGLKCPYCNESDFSKGADILDVWFDSGVSHQAVLKKRQALGGTPCELYLEGSDQHRGWFQSSLIPSVCIDDKAPFKAVLTHGFVVDGEGRKMSKSLGNVISPQEVIKKSGADILRLWVSSSDYNADIRISAEIMQRLSESYRKIRNTCRFVLSNLYDFDPDSDKAEYSQLKKIDKWILWKTEELKDTVTSSYEGFEFYKAQKTIYDFCNEALSMYYLDMVKGRLYTYPRVSAERRAAQTAMYHALGVIVRLIAPILSFTAEEIYKSMPKEKSSAVSASVHLLDWPVSIAEYAQKDLVASGADIGTELSVVMQIIPDVAKLLEEERSSGRIRSSFDAEINLLTKDENRYKYLACLKEELCEMFKVSSVFVVKAQDYGNAKISVSFPDIAIEAQKAKGKKCQRCWNYSDTVKGDDSYGEVCQRCLTAIGGN